MNFLGQVGEIKKLAEIESGTVIDILVVQMQDSNPVEGDPSATQDVLLDSRIDYVNLLSGGR